MKTLKMIAIISTSIMILTTAEFASLPVQFHHTMILWHPILVYAYCLLCLSILPLLGLFLSMNHIRLVILGMGTVSFLFMGMGPVPFAFELIFLALLLLFHYSIFSILKTKKTAEDVLPRK
ncbi:MAG TPA: hypothetical protein VLX61_03465 [Anaerolineales bacterium]|nr:hypothetical protein [Anaerolineales bacterium]